MWIITPLTRVGDQVWGWCGNLQREWDRDPEEVGGQKLRKRNRDQREVDRVPERWGQRPERRRQRIGSPKGLRREGSAPHIPARS